MDQHVKPMTISLKQQKVISHPLRVQIIFLLAETAMTPKQTAEYIKKNAGTTYYHIQQLYNNGILEIDHIETTKGIVEKYYKAKATLFRVEEDKNNILKDFHTRRTNYLMLSEDEVEALNEEISQLFYKYTQLSLEEGKERSSYQLNFEVSKYLEE